MNTSALPAPLVLGLTLITANARRQLEPEDVSRSLQRHARRDWGRCRPQNPPAHAASLEGGCRLLSVYKDRQGIDFGIITEADLSRTWVLLPEDCGPACRRSPLRWPIHERFVKEN